jgi:hypothetical protein
MMDTAATTQAAPTKRGVNVWMFVAIGAIVIALITGYLAWSYKQQVDEWQSAADETVAKLESAGIELKSAVESGVDGYEQQISDLTQALEEAETQGGIAAGQLQETEQELADTQQQLADTQAALDDANAKLEQVGQLVLSNGTYVGLVLAARVDPFPAIVFQDGTVWRVAQVAPDVAITAGSQSLTLDQLSALLQSTNPDTVALANGEWNVQVAKGQVTTIQSVGA